MQIERIRAHHNDRHWMMVDHDNAPTTQAQTLYGIEPNIVIYNQTNPSRHQAFWLLGDPVFCQPEARERAPYRYLKAIESAYDERYGTDHHFARNIHRNPCSFLNDVDWRHWRPHTLAELAEPVQLSAHRAKALDRSLTRSGSAAEGRNCALFDALRHWAYSQVEIARGASYEVWYRQVSIRAQAMAAQLVSAQGVLPAREVGYVASSVASFVYYRYSAGAGSIMTPEYRAKQAERGAKGGRVSRGGGRPSNSGKARADLLPEVLRLKGLGYSNRDIAEDLQISAGSVSNYLRRDPE
jgi:hypothetical protein